MSITLQQLYEKIVPLVGKHICSPLTKNKGATGLLLETITGIPHTPNCLDCSDGELKTFPIKKRKDGSFLPKETIAVTMLCEDSLKTCSYQESRCAKKMNRVIFVPYLREGEMITYFKPVLWEAEKQQEICRQLQEDYQTIQTMYVNEKILKSEVGKYLQTRTKGAGHGSTSRAFYLRTCFLKEHIPIHL